MGLAGEDNFICPGHGSYNHKKKYYSIICCKILYIVMNMYIYINLNKWPYLSFNLSMACFSHPKVSIIQVVFIHF